MTTQTMLFAGPPHGARVAAQPYDQSFGLTATRGLTETCAVDRGEMRAWAWRHLYLTAGPYQGLARWCLMSWGGS
jgi:hypothetical protein